MSNMQDADFPRQTALMNGTPVYLGQIEGSGVKSSSNTATPFTLAAGQVVELQGGDAPMWVGFGSTSALAIADAATETGYYLDAREKSRPIVLSGEIAAAGGAVFIARTPDSGTPKLQVRRLK